MTASHFFSALLLGLRQFCDEFPTHVQFHKAAFATLEQSHIQIQGRRWIRPDPVFGNVTEIDVAILEALQDGVIGLLSPAQIKARFRIDRARAEQELRTLAGDDAPHFIELGRHLDGRLT
jgi:hypothetical protein